MKNIIRFLILFFIISSYTVCNSAKSGGADSSETGNARLSSIMVSQGNLSPDFSPETTEYSLEVVSNVNSLRLLPVKEDPAASDEISLKVNSAVFTVKSGDLSEPCAINSGPNIISLTVTAGDGTAKAYTINVLRNETVLNFRVITVPLLQHDPSEPHHAYNGHDTTFKAIARNSMETVYFRWDIDGNGSWDELKSRTTVRPGRWYMDSRYNLGGVQALPHVDPSQFETRTFFARIEVAEDVDENGNPVNGSMSAFYPVKVISSVPVQENADNATNASLREMRIVAVDDALWFLHAGLYRTGSDTNQITGYFNSVSDPAVADVLAAWFLYALTCETHSPAYPDGTAVYSKSYYPETLSINSMCWNTDPYAEDAARLMNYLLSRIQNTTYGWMVNSVSNQLNNQAFAVIALVSAGWRNPVVQVGPFSGSAFSDVVKMFVDYIQAAQINKGAGHLQNGGWGTSPGATPNGYNTGGFIYALKKVESLNTFYGAALSSDVKDRAAKFLVSIAAQDEGAGYRINALTGSIEITGLIMSGCDWLGWNKWSVNDTTSAGYSSIPELTRGQAAVLYHKYYNYICNNWSLANPDASSFEQQISFWSDGNYGSDSAVNSMIYSMLNTKIASVDSVPCISDYFNGVTSHSWSREFAIDLVREQNADGSFPVNSSYWIHSIYGCGYAGQTAVSALLLTCGMGLE